MLHAAGLKSYYALPLFPFPASFLQDFKEMLPMPPYTLPTGAPLNLASMLPPWANATDLGPKTYIASGRVSVNRRLRAV